MSIVHAREVHRLRTIERMVQVPLHKMEIPLGKDVCRKQFNHFMDKLLSTDISHGDYETYMPLLEEKFADVSKEDVLKMVAAQEFDRFLKYYENSEDLNIRGRDSRDRGVERDGGNRQRDDRSGGTR
jgi:ATP-dependent RNA helicase DeaD